MSKDKIGYFIFGIVIVPALSVLFFMLKLPQRKPLRIKFVEAVMISLIVQPFVILAVTLWLNRAGEITSVWMIIVIFVFAIVGSALVFFSYKELLDRYKNLEAYDK